MSNRGAERMDSLTALGRLDDADIDLAECALLLAGLDRPKGDLSPFRDHLAELVRDVKADLPGEVARDVSARRAHWPIPFRANTIIRATR